ncbi:MAG: hypothetical protein CMQ19_00035, partial [Gammaproteobacteria bacterium]|nr:hypothetical protein [Gammaproteobacteria bacterium]
ASRFLDDSGNELNSVGSDIEVISSTKYWAGQYDIFHFNTELDNPNGVKSVVISEKTDSGWLDLASKSADEIYGTGDTLPASISWGYGSLESSIGRASIFGNNELRIQSFYEDANGTTHVSNSYYDKNTVENFINYAHDVNSSDSFVAQSLSGGVFNNDFSYDATKQESVNIAVDMKVTGAAGSVIDVTKGLFQVTAAGMNQNPDTEETPKVFVSESGSKNLITFQGDLNYDGRVSMKDLAYLNAGAARQQTTTENTTGDDLDSNGVVDASVAHDVDADFNGKIDLEDLAILDRDWGETLHSSLHQGDEVFTGSGDLSWQALDNQGGATWDNDAFKDQHSIEASSDHIGSLESPTTTDVIGADGNKTANDEDTQGGFFQDSLPA